MRRLLFTAAALGAAALIAAAAAAGYGFQPASQAWQLVVVLGTVAALAAAGPAPAPEHALAALHGRPPGWTYRLGPLLPWAAFFLLLALWLGPLPRPGAADPGATPLRPNDPGGAAGVAWRRVGDRDWPVPLPRPDRPSLQPPGAPAPAAPTDAAPYLSARPAEERLLAALGSSARANTVLARVHLRPLPPGRPDAPPDAAAPLVVVAADDIPVSDPEKRYSIPPLQSTWPLLSATYRDGAPTFHLDPRYAGFDPEDRDGPEQPAVIGDELVAVWRDRQSAAPQGWMAPREAVYPTPCSAAEWPWRRAVPLPPTEDVWAGAPRLILAGLCALCLGAWLWNGRRA